MLRLRRTQKNRRAEEPKKKIEIIENILKSQVSKETIKHITLITNNSRESFLDQIIINFIKIYKKQKNILSVKIKSPYEINEKQKDLYSCLQGAFGSLTNNNSSSALFELSIDSESGDTPSALGAGTVSKAQSLLGDQGDKLTTIAMHSKVFYALKER